MKTNHTMILTGILLLGVLLVSACTQTYSQSPAGTPSLIPTGLFVSPFPSGQDPLQIIAQLGTQTAQAETAAAGGATVAVVGTPGTPGTPATTAADTDTPTVGTPATAVTTGATLLPVTVIPSGSTFTPTTQPGSTVVVPTISGTVGPVPATYTLQKGEFPYCIARRYNVDPLELLTKSGLSADQGNIFLPGLVLNLPQTGDPFPTTRALHSHPSTWTVDPGDTLNSIACYYGDLSPQQIATANNLTTSSILTTGQQLTIP
jgi:LysM repeat protein